MNNIKIPRHFLLLTCLLHGLHFYVEYDHLFILNLFSLLLSI